MNDKADDLDIDGDENSYSEEENDEEENLLLYNRAIKLKAAGKLDEALKYFTKCLEGVDAANPFTKLPHCLREIAGIYYDKEDYEKAVQFAQAEKLYYEAALVNSPGTAPSRNLTQNNTSNDQYIRKADEYEQLASLCLKQHKIHLALEYCGKVAKIRQLTLGPSNPATIRSLDMFTVLYAEAGRQQYADALRVTRNSVKDDGGAVTEHTEELDDQTNCEEKSDETEESEATSTAEVIKEVNVDSTESRTVRSSSIMYTKKAVLFYFLLSSTFAIILTFWIL